MQKQILYSADGTPNLEFLYRCLIDIAAGMDYLHSLGVINGDLKPANVLLKSTNEDVRGFICKVCSLSCRRLLQEALPYEANFESLISSLLLISSTCPACCVQLADFGLSRVLDTDRTHVSTQTYGTLAYQPAELLQEGRLTKAADVHSFSMIMYEMYTKQRLFDGCNTGQVTLQELLAASGPAREQTPYLLLTGI